MHGEHCYEADTLVCGWPAEHYDGDDWYGRKVALAIRDAGTSWPVEAWRLTADPLTIAERDDPSIDYAAQP